MADIKKIKDKIKSTIYPNGKGAINATDHQAMLLEMADGMAETDTKLTELSAEINGKDTRVVLNVVGETTNYGTINLTNELSKFVSGKTYKLEPHTEYVVGLQYKVNNGAMQNLGRPNYEGGKWVYPNFEFPSNVTYLALESRTSENVTNDVDIIDVNGVITDGLVGRVESLEKTIPQIEENKATIDEIMLKINGENTRLILNVDVELGGYGTFNITDQLSKFVVGASYKLEPHTEYVVGLQYKVNNGATQNLGRPNFEGGKWVYPSFQFPANVTYLALESRTPETQTHNVDIIDVNGVVVEGITERLDDLESLSPIVSENVSDIADLEAKLPNIKGRKLYIEGASFVDWNIGFYGDNPISYGNGWFEIACEKLGLLPLNKARSGSTIIDFARGISGKADAQGNKVNAAWTDEEFEEFDILAIMHTHNYDIADSSVIKDNYDGSETFLNLPLKNAGRVGYICDQLTPEYFAQAYDYVLKEYAKKCYACKDKVGSRWYGTKMGKPFKVILCTHWHDARITFNESVRELQQKWGFELCQFDKHVGFSKNQVNPSTGEQTSILYCDNDIANTEDISGVTYGWHPTRGKEAYIQKAMASIFVDAIKPILCDSDFTK